MTRGEELRCPRCGATGSGGLAVIDVIGVERLRSAVTRWKSDAVVEVRRCSSCASTVARMADAPGVLERVRGRAPGRRESSVDFYEVGKVACMPCHGVVARLSSG